MPRGQKKCSECGVETGPRAKYCPGCAKAFHFAPKSVRRMKAGKKIDWKELEKDDYIKSIQGHGPFWAYKNLDTEETEPIMMGHYGIYKVSFVHADGIGCYEIHKGYRSGGFCFLYMGEPKISKWGTIMRSHKIRKVIPRNK